MGEGTFTLDGTATINTNSFEADVGHGISVGDVIELYEYFTDPTGT